MADRRPVHLALAAGLVLTSSASCVYFNTYYNAEKFFRQAEKARAEVEEERAGSETGRRSGRGGRGGSYQGLYEKAVRKASIVLEKYPDSELVDDAMFLAGRALYWQRDYAYGARSFEDLERNFPDSEYVDRARFWRARCLREQGDMGEARALFTALILEGSDIGGRAGMELGDMALAGGDLRAAIQDYRTSLRAFPGTPLSDRLWLRIGNAHLSLGGPADLDSAAVAYGRAIDEARADSVEYRARLNRGLVLYHQGAPDAALEAYRSLLREGRFRPWEGETRILIGRCHRESGAPSEALDEFERVRNDFPGTGVSAMALYQTGLVYLQDRGDRQQAQKHFREVGQERRGSEGDSLAGVMLRTTDRLDALLDGIYRADSTAAALRPGSDHDPLQTEPDTADAMAAVPPGPALESAEVRPGTEAASAPGLLPAAVPGGGPATDDLTGPEATVAAAAMPADSTLAAAEAPEVSTSSIGAGALDSVAAESRAGIAVDSLLAAARPGAGADSAAATSPGAATAARDSTRVEDADSTAVPEPPPEAQEPEDPLGLEGYVVAADSLGVWVPLVARPPLEEGPGAEERARDRRRRLLQSGRPGADRPPTLMDNLFSAAEVYRDRLGLPDSAAVLYEAIADRFPGSREIPRALYNLAWTHIEQKADTVAARPFLERLVAGHPATEHASAARRYLGLAAQASAEDQAARIFDDIERMRLDFPDEPARWVPRLDELAGAYPGTRVSGRAIFLAAWAAENLQGDSTGAAARYDSVLAHYPGSRHADLVERRRQAERDGVVDRLERELRGLRDGADPGDQILLVGVEPVIEDSVSRAKNHVGFGMRAVRRGDFSAAQELFELSLDEKQTANTEPVVGLGEGNWRQGYLEDAVDYMRRALKQRSRSILPHYRLFAYHVQRGQADSANNYLRTIVRRDPQSAGVGELLLQFPGLDPGESQALDIDELERLELEPEDEHLEMPLRYFGVAEPPMVRSSPAPEYPSGQTDSSTVLVDVLVSETGRAEEVSLYRGEEPFASAALAAVGGYTFYPAEGVDERPVRAWVEVEVSMAPPVPDAGEDMTRPSGSRPGEPPPVMAAGQDVAEEAAAPPMPAVEQEDPGEE
ncbi:MAG: tetratricopeptide repeat protein [Gemmatimonadaceae bacterium]|nr:tetratricopeptide repeat protein [Gemmatimonadaceae bacterium]